MGRQYWMSLGLKLASAQNLEKHVRETVPEAFLRLAEP